MTEPPPSTAARSTDSLVPTSTSKSKPSLTKKTSDPGRALSPLSRGRQRRVAPMALTEETGPTTRAPRGSTTTARTANSTPRSTSGTDSSVRGVRDRASVTSSSSRTRSAAAAAAASRRERASAAAAAAVSRGTNSTSRTTNTTTATNASRRSTMKASNTTSTTAVKTTAAPRTVNKAILLDDDNHKTASTTKTSKPSSAATTNQLLEQTLRAPKAPSAAATAAVASRTCENHKDPPTPAATTNTINKEKEEEPSTFRPAQAKETLIKALGLETFLGPTTNTSEEDPKEDTSSHKQDHKPQEETSATSTTTKTDSSTSTGSSLTNQTSNVTKADAANTSTDGMEAHQQTTQRLMALRHAAKCQHTDTTTCPTHAHCRQMKGLLKHMEQCHLTSECLVAHCSSSKQFYDVIYPLSSNRTKKTTVAVDVTAAAVAAVAANPKPTQARLQVPSTITTVTNLFRSSNHPDATDVSVASGLTGAMGPVEQLDVERGGSDPLRHLRLSPSWMGGTKSHSKEQQALLANDDLRRSGRRPGHSSANETGGLAGLLNSILKSYKSQDHGSTTSNRSKSGGRRHHASSKYLDDGNHWDAQDIRDDVDAIPMKRPSTDAYPRMMRCLCLFLGFLMLLIGLSMGLFYFMAAGEWDALMASLGWGSNDTPSGYTPVSPGDYHYPTSAPSPLVLDLPQYTLEELQLGGPPVPAPSDQKGVAEVSNARLESPQMKAFRWIQSERRYIENLLKEKAEDMAAGKSVAEVLTEAEYHNVLVYTDIHWKHRFALATLYYSTTMTKQNSTDGVVVEESDWTNHRNWLAKGVPECQWNFVACDRGESLWISNNNLRGTLPPELGLLTGLKDLAIMNHPLLVGSLPSELGLLDKTMSVNLASNAFSGTIPKHWGNMEQLRWLYLNNNNLVGTIPKSFGQMSQLAFLWMHGNRLSGPLPFSEETADWKYLQEIMLHSNFLTGSLPEDLGTRLPRGRLIDLHSNSLRGKIPSSLSLMTDLEVLKLHQNELSGSVPEEVCQMLRRGQLLVLSVDCDKVSCDCGCTCGLDKQVSASGPAPTVATDVAYAAGVAEPSAKTTEFMLRLPDFTQDAMLIEDSPQSRALDWLMNDPSVGSYSMNRMLQRFSLATLYFSTNGDGWAESEHWLSYSEHECSWYSTAEDVCVQLEEGGDYLMESLMEWGNKLSGTIPPEISLMPTLKWLFLGLNELEGPVPPQVGLLAGSLERLNLMRNQLTGSIATEFGLLTHLEKLDLSENTLTGTLPDLGQLKHLENLYLNNNALKGQLPSSVGSLVNIEGLNFGDNLFSGSLPTSIGNLKEAKWVNLFGNSLTFALPTEIGLLSSLVSLSVRDNDFIGPIPDELGQLSSSHSLTLDLRNNMFANSIPSSLGALSNLGQLLLDGNDSLMGQMPQEICKLASSGHLSVLTIDCSAVECPQNCLGKSGSLCTCVIPP